MAAGCYGRILNLLASRKLGNTSGKGNLFIQKWDPISHLGHRYVWDKFWAHWARTDAIQQAAGKPSPCFHSIKASSTSLGICTYCAIPTLQRLKRTIISNPNISLRNACAHLLKYSLHTPHCAQSNNTLYMISSMRIKVVDDFIFDAHRSSLGEDSLAETLI